MLSAGIGIRPISPVKLEELVAQVRRGPASECPFTSANQTFLRMLAPIDADLEYLHRATIAKRLGVPASNLVGILDASYTAVYQYFPDFKKKGSERMGDIPLQPGTSAGWVPLVATTFADQFDGRTRTIKFAPPG